MQERPLQSRLAFATTHVATRLPAPRSLRELELRAAALAGRRVGELARQLGCAVPTQGRHAKGFVGQLVERALGADPTAADGPDFPTLGVELKTIPVAHGRPVESTFCCSIAMRAADRERWESSRLRRRLAQVLWVPVDAPRLAPLVQRRFGRSVLWRPDARVWAQLRADWEDLIGALGSGRTPSAGDGVLLQVRPKAANARSRTLGIGDDGGGALTLPLGFYLRPAFTAQLLA